MANTRLTLAALFDTVVTASSAINTTLNAVTDGVEMGHNSIKSWKQEQEFRNIVNTIHFKSSYIEEKAMELTNSRMRIQEFRLKSKEHAKLFDSALAELNAALQGDEGE